MPPDVQRRCDNPECLERVMWRPGRGRPQRYCSDRCRQRMMASHRRLTDEADRLTHLLTTDVTFRQGRELRSDLARVEWLLSAYPPQ